MAAFDELHNLKDLLAENNVSPETWVEMRQPGFSGARIYRQADGAEHRHVVKVTSARTDWIMRATSDERCRRRCWPVRLTCASMGSALLPSGRRRTAPSSRS